jgi:hypothetical protein
MLPAMADDQKIDIDQGWLDWVVENLGRSPTRARAAALAASEVANRGLGFNAAADAAKADWAESGPQPLSQAERAAATGVPSTLAYAMALAVGGALASLVLIASITQPWAPCTGNLCGTFRALGAEFALANIAIATVHSSLFFFMWRRAAWAWWLTLGVVVAVLLFDITGEATTIAMLMNPRVVIDPLFSTIGTYGDLINAAMELEAAGRGLGPLAEAVGTNWLAFHFFLVEVPIFLLLAARPTRAWCQIQSPIKY